MKHLLVFIMVLGFAPCWAQSGRDRGGDGSEWSIDRGRDDNGQAIYCILRRAYAEQRGLAIAMTADGSLEFGMFNSGRNIEDGPLPISVSIDGSQPIDLPAVSTLGGKLVTIPATDGLTFLRRLVSGQVFLAMTPSGTEQFELDGVEEASVGLVKCAVALAPPPEPN